MNRSDNKPMPHHDLFKQRLRIKLVLLDAMIVWLGPRQPQARNPFINRKQW